jgi:hypothetical protein
VAHADWSASPDKRWLCRATSSLAGNTALTARARTGVGYALKHLKEDAGLNVCLLIGFDFPIGLPLAYAERAGSTTS